MVALIVIVVLFYALYWVLKPIKIVRLGQEQDSIRSGDMSLPGYKRSSTQLKAADLPIFGLAGLLGLSFWYLFRPQELGIQVFYYSLAIQALTLLVMRRYKRPVSSSSYIVGLLALIFAGLVGVFQSPLLASLNFLMAIWLNGFLLVTLAGLDIKRLSVAGMLSAPIMAPVYFLIGMSGLRRSRPALAEGSSLAKPVSRDALHGGAIGLVLFVVFGFLFLSADQTLAGYFDFSDFRFAVDTSTTLALMFTFLGVGVFGSIWYYLTSMSPVNYVQKHFKQTEILAPSSTQIALTSMVALFGLFALAQLPVILGPAARSADGELASNAREGFGQLMVAGSLVLGVLSVFISRTKSFLEDKRNRLLAVTWIALTLVILASAYRRLYEYEAAYGFTVSRLFAHSVILLLGALLIGFGYRILAKKSEAWYALLILTAVSAWLLGLNMINPDRFIADINTDRASSRPVDYGYLRTLSIDATPSLMDGICIAKVDYDWRTWTWSAYRHNQLLDELGIEDSRPLDSTLYLRLCNQPIID